MEIIFIILIVATIVAGTIKIILQEKSKKDFTSMIAVGNNHEAQLKAGRAFFILLITTIIAGLITTLIYFASSLPSVVRKEYKNVDVTIVNSSHSNAAFWGLFTWTRYVSFFAPMHTEEENRITVVYEDKEYTIRGDSSYEKYLDKKGKQVTGILETKYYSDDSISYDIVALKEKFR